MRNSIFHEILFLSLSIPPRCLETVNKKYNKYCVFQGSDIDDVEPAASPDASSNVSNVPDTLPAKTPPSRPSSSASCKTTASAPGKFKRTKLEDTVLATVGERLADLKREDQFDVFGKNVAMKLRSLPQEQRIYAEKKD